MTLLSSYIYIFLSIHSPSSLLGLELVLQHPSRRPDLVPIQVAALQQTLVARCHGKGRARVQHAVVVETHDVAWSLKRRSFRRLVKFKTEQCILIELRNKVKCKLGV